MKLIGLILMAGFSLAPSAMAQTCGLSVVASDLVMNWDLNWTTHAISISVSKTNPAACSFGLGFSKGQSGSYTRYTTQSGKQLNYQLYQDNSSSKILRDVPDITTTNDVIMGNLPAGSNPQTFFYYFDIPYAAATSPSLASAGIYTDGFQINAYEGTTPTAFASPPAASTQVNVSITVDKMIALSLVDTGGVFQDSATTKSINFGYLSTGQTSRFDIRVRTNAGYSLTLQSGNNGKLKHSSSNSTVPYSIYVNNAPADLSGVAPVITGSGSTSLSGLGLPTKIVIGTVGAQALSGNYSDTVTITATATE